MGSLRTLFEQVGLLGLPKYSNPYEKNQISDLDSNKTAVTVKTHYWQPFGEWFDFPDGERSSHISLMNHWWISSFSRDSYFFLVTMSKRLNNRTTSQHFDASERFSSIWFIVDISKSLYSISTVHLIWTESIKFERETLKYIGRLNLSLFSSQDEPNNKQVNPSTLFQSPGAIGRREGICSKVLICIWRGFAGKNGSFALQVVAKGFFDIMKEFTESLHGLIDSE